MAHQGPIVRVPRRPGPVAVAAAFVVLAYHAGPRGETWRLEPTLETTATWTDNVALEDRASAQDDTILELVPGIVVRGEGRRLRVSGGLSLRALTYANGTRDDRLLPTADLSANLEAVERILFLDARVVSRQGAEDVFGPRSDNSDVNTVTTTQYLLSPSLEGRPGGDTRLRLRSTNSWTDVSGEGTQADSAYQGDHVLRLERPPAPLGWSVELARNETRFESQAQPSATIDSGRLTIDYAIGADFVAALRGGYERTNLLVENRSQSIYGAGFNWQPTPRTQLDGLWEERFFGSAWRLRFTHRMPRLAWNIGTSRDVLSFPQAFLTLAPTSNVRALLDAAFTTRFPDAAERGRVVGDLIARMGLPASLASETSLFSQRVSIVTSRSAMITLVGVRNTFALSAYSNHTQALADPVFTALIPGAAQDVLQEGVSFTVSHQLSAVSAVNLTAEAGRTRGRGVDEGQRSTQAAGRLQWTRQLAPRTSTFVGARVQDFESNVPGTVADARERAAFVGLAHRF
jgi:uncharacterized protein (PEP-CTERM system associated)